MIFVHIGDFHFLWECQRVILDAFWGDVRVVGSLSNLRQHINNYPIHRLQLSLNLRDSPGFLATVPHPGRLYCNCIIGPGRGPDTSINTVVETL